MISNSAFNVELNKFLTMKGQKEIWRYDIEIRAGSETVTSARFQSMEEEMDFVGLQPSAPYTPAIFLSLAINKLTYKKSIFPNRKNLRITLLRKRMISDNTTDYSDVEKSTYIAKMVDPVDIDYVVNDRELEVEREMELAGDVDVGFQLVELSLPETHVSSVGGIYRKTDLVTLLKVLMAPNLKERVSKTVLESPGYNSIRGVQVSPPTNTKVYSIVEVPNTRLVDLPNVLQRDYGLYATGISSFLLRGFWYVFASRDHTLYSKSDKVLTVFDLPAKETAGIEKTFRTDGGNLSIITTGDSNILDISTNSQFEYGNGLRYFRASDLVDGLHSVSGNKVEMDPVSNRRNFLLYNEGETANYIKWPSSGLFTDNPYPDLSKMSQGVGKYVNITWENSNPLLIFPGMPVRVYYSKNGEITSMDGIVSGMRSSTSLPQTNLTSRNTYTRTALTVYVK